jgi:hypothetical protein
MAILSPLRLEGWVIGRAPTVPESRLYRSLAIHSLLPPPSPPLFSPNPQLQFSSFLSLSSAQGCPPPLCTCPPGMAAVEVPHLLRAGCCTRS